MNSREKRSSGGYGLRRKIAKKRLDEDFEYYYAGTNPQIETPTSNIAQEKQSDKIQTHLVVVTKLINPQGKCVRKDSECFEKRPRGRPRKHQLAQDVLDSPSNPADLKNKNLNSFKAVENITVAEVDERKEESLVLIEKKEESLMSLAQVVKIEHLESVDARRAKQEILTADGMTELHEEEVSSLPEGEKENLPEDGINLVAESDTEEKINVHMENDESQEEYDHDLIYEEYEKITKGPSVFIRKRKKENLSHEDIQKLNQLNPDDKIECSECHKLLKPSSFRQHLRTHTGEKPFGCEVCDARFTRKGDVERHVRIVHNKQKPFKCSRCQRAFGDKKNLRWHLMNHDKKLFYVCEVCGFKFGKREYWENHVRFIHPLQGALDLDGNSSVQVEDESEDRLHTLTATLIGEDDTSENGTNHTLALRSTEQKKPETVVSEMHLPMLNQISEQEGIKVINIKTLSNLVKLGYSKKQENVRVYGRPVSASEQEGIEAVVIQVDECYSESDSIHSQYTEQQSSNVIRVVNPSEVIPVVEMEKNERKNNRFVVETQNSKEDAVTDSEGVHHKQVLKTSEKREDTNSIQYVCDENAQSSKLISFMLTDDNASTSEANSASVHTLIEALLVAAKGDGQQKDSQST